MNELVYVKDNYNIISVCFIRNTQPYSCLYDWYLPYHYLDRVHINDNVKIKVNNKVQKVRIINLTYHPLAKDKYVSFPLVHSQPSWQVRRICEILNQEGIEYYRERCFKGLINIDGKPLHVDISFKKDNRWYLIEYHGVHHYFKLWSTLRRFNNIRRIMELKRNWSIRNKIPYLEIPFFRQNEIEELVKQFLSENIRREEYYRHD
ncbi:hypothetical protein ACSG6T_002483 [Enterococcus faecalis]